MVNKLFTLTVWEQEIYSYDQNNNLIKVQNSDISWDEYAYNSDNQLLWIRSYYDGRSHYNVSYVYDEKGNMLECWGYVSMTGGFPITYFGENGLPTRTAYRNKQGDILDSVYDEYDEHGNLIREQSFEDGICVSKIERTYISMKVDID